MSEFQLALLIGAIVAAIISSNLPRAWLWIMCAAFSFIASTAYYRLGYPYYPIATLIFDGCVCLAIYSRCSERWEEILFRLFQASTLVSLIYAYLLFFSQTPEQNHTLYVALLEIINWLALALVGGVGIADRMRANEGSHVRNWLHGVHRSLLALRKARKTVQWYKVAR